MQKIIVERKLFYFIYIHILGEVLKYRKKLENSLGKEFYVYRGEYPYVEQSLCGRFYKLILSTFHKNLFPNPNKII